MIELWSARYAETTRTSVIPRPTSPSPPAPGPGPVPAGLHDAVRELRVKMTNLQADVHHHRTASADQIALRLEHLASGLEHAADAATVSKGLRDLDGALDRKADRAEVEAALSRRVTAVELQVRESHNTSGRGHPSPTP